MSSITIRGARKSYGKTEVVKGVDLAIADGEFVVVLGPSGCGKSTLLRMIAGLEDITAGEIAIADQVVNKLEPRARGCAMVFQNYALYPHMTIAENIGYALKVAGVPKAERDARVKRIAATLGLDAFLARRPGELSGGQRQRVAMGRAMIREPKVFLFDEPLSNLDAKLRVSMRIEIRKLHNRLKTTSVFVTHDQIEAMTLADRLVVMNSGRIEQIGTPEQVYRTPATRFVAGFIGSPAMNLIEGKVTGGSEVGFGEVRLKTAHGGLVPGQPVLIGLRAEECVSAHDGAPNAFALDVDFTEELGAARLLHGEVSGAPFIAQVGSNPEGQRLGRHLFSAAPEAIHLFDTATGARIGVEAALAKAA